MSLVEKALKKIQESHLAGTVASPPGARRLADPGTSNRAVDTAVTPTAAVSGAERRVVPRPVTNEVLEVSRSALRAAGMLPPENQERQIADQYRQIKRPLIDAAVAVGGVAGNSHVIMVTSALPGDGKTFTSINLAISMSLEKDVTVLLIDADAAKPSLSRTFGVENKPGLLDLLRDDDLDLEQLVLPTSIPGLSILPIGKRGEHATELFASQRMAAIANRLAGYESHRVAVIDSSPLLLTSESRVLAQNVGQIVVVVRAGVTSQQSVLDALSYLGDHKSIGLVLNQSMREGTLGYYYGYGDAGNLPASP